MASTAEQWMSLDDAVNALLDAGDDADTIVDRVTTLADDWNADNEGAS